MREIKNSQNLPKPIMPPERLVEAILALNLAGLEFGKTLLECIQDGSLVWSELPAETQRSMVGLLVSIVGPANLSPELRSLVEQ